LYQVPLTGNHPDLGHVQGSFKLVANSTGQVWNLSEVNGMLLMGHNDGAFLVNPESATPVDNTTGFWGFQPFSPIQPSDIMMAGTYNGINFYSFEHGRFVNHGVHTHFESARYICIDDDAIWVAHPYKGLFRIRYQPPGLPGNKQYSDVAGILSLNRNYLYKIKSRIVLTTEKGIYEYNAAKDDFEPSAYFRNLFGDRRVQYLKEDPSGNIWFIQDKKLGVVDLSEATPRMVFFPELNNKIMGNGYEHIYPYDEQNIFVAAEEGFYLINYSQYIQNKPQLHILLRTVKAIAGTDSLLSGGYVTGEANVSRFSHRFNAFRFQYSSPFYDQQNNIEYSYFLEGLDEQWSDWSKRTEKDYTSLHPGSYRFRVKARNQPGQESPEVVYAFRILPPWYLSRFAYFVYTLLIALGVYRLYRWQNKKFLLQQQRHEEEQKRLQYMHQLEMDRTEKEIIKLRNEKLEAEIDHKNKELASSAMHLVQKGELITKLKDDLTRLSKNMNNEKAGDDFKKLIRILDRDTQMDTDWEHFAQHFDNVHSDFLVELKNRFPQLTPSEIKLCAFLRMNLSSKEIARLLNISIRGVEVSRYRLRKKLKLPTEVNLYDYLMNPDMVLPREEKDGL
jgi:DNA-binding CsgD family transcriptional regulator